ncbi:hypothetical protein G6F57_021341 [Rhizopus arrhizus]|nr:hypothetical protein G6F57_021341 [Rhizopus arrhizus]
MPPAGRGNALAARARFSRMTPPLIVRSKIMSPRTGLKGRTPTDDSRPAGLAMPFSRFCDGPPCRLSTPPAMPSKDPTPEFRDRPWSGSSGVPDIQCPRFPGRCFRWPAPRPRIVAALPSVTPYPVRPAPGWPAR